MAEVAHGHSSSSVAVANDGKSGHPHSRGSVDTLPRIAAQRGRVTSIACAAIARHDSRPHHDGRFLTAVINFLIIAATLFVIIRAFEEMQKRRKGAGEDVAEDKSDEVVLLGEIRDLLTGDQQA